MRNLNLKYKIVDRYIKRYIDDFHTISEPLNVNNLSDSHENETDYSDFFTDDLSEYLDDYIFSELTTDGSDPEYIEDNHISSIQIKKYF